MAKIIGIDAGIASIGWAVIETTDHQGRILACGTRMFDAPETDKERKPTNSIRREKRGMRRVIRRRRQRMTAIRRLLAAHALLPTASSNALAIGLNPWELRAEALDRALTAPELATVLGHIAAHRGFRSNAKADRGANAADESSKMKAAIAATQERLQQYRTVGEMFARDPQFAACKRNRGGAFTRSILREDQEREIGKIFTAQRRLGSPLATEALEQAYFPAAFDQRPLQDSEHLVGPCPFIPTERRCARRAPSFELFRLLSRLNAIRLAAGGTERPLTPAEIALVSNDFGAQKSLSWKFLRKRLDLDPATRFAGIPPDAEKNDFVARSGNAAEGTHALRAAITAHAGPEAWATLQKTPALLDAIAALLSFRADLGSIANGIRELPLDPSVADAVIAATNSGAFHSFAGAGHISATAARALLPHLAAGHVYSEACALAGFDHAAATAVSIEDVRNPVARKAVSEVLKQVKVLVHEFGLPDAMHIELARDVGKGAEERAKITRGIEDRNKQRDRLRERFAADFGRQPTAEDLLRFELWNEQNGRCLYTDTPIPPAAIAAADNTVQVDHILPWSRFGDDSFINKTLCTAAANADKRGRTPYEWFTADKSPDQWTTYERAVEACKSMKGRKKSGHYLRRNATEVEERFKARNLGDTRYATRLVLDLLRRKYYPDKETRHVLARPGALTARLRRGWGLEGLKKDASGQRRADDRHHALDAIVLAACTESMVNRLTRAFQISEQRGLRRDFSALDQPWPGFREQAIAAFESVFVSRAERHRARGEAHAATIKQVRIRDGKTIVYERKAIDALKLSDLALIKDADRNAAIVESLRQWIEAAKPKDNLPTSPKGDMIRKVRLASKDKVAVDVRDGTADRGDMARVDVFRKDDPKGRPRLYLVPVYPHQVATLAAPPNRAVDQGKNEPDWTLIDGSFSFLFSLYPNSFVEIGKPDGEILNGYFKGLHRQTGAITLANHRDHNSIKSGLGARMLLRLRKFNVDRLGRVTEIPQETRTWHGAACT
jgi:CRISPR-associated endonuclease Csn1